MENITPDDFEKMKNEAAERMRQMTRRDMPPFPSFVKVPERSHKDADPPAPNIEPKPMSAIDKQKNNRANSLLKYVNIPEMLKNSDSMLLLSLILLLANEEADETLILALAYILL